MFQNNVSKLRAEYSMGVKDYDRYDAMLKKADELALRVRPPYIDINMVAPYYSILRQLYINFRPVLEEVQRIKVEKFFIDIKKQMLGFSGEIIKRNNRAVKINQELLENLEKMHMLLLEIKQLIGLGINIIREQTLKTKLNRALLGINEI